MSVLFRDDFDGALGSKPNPLLWDMADDNFGLADGELQAYHPSQISLDGNGNCVLTAIQSPYKGAQYTSGRMHTRKTFQFTYGEVEVVGYYPLGSLIYASLAWLGGYDLGRFGWEEIDITELYTDQTAIRTTLIGHNGIIGSTLHSQDPSKKHSTKLRWLDSSIEWILNEKSVYKITSQQIGSQWVFNKPLFIVTDLALRGSGPQSFPAKMVLDSISVSTVPIVIPVPDPIPQPGGTQMDGAMFLAKSSRWFIEGLAVYAFATAPSDPVWLEYKLDFGMGGNSLNVAVANQGSLPVPAGYAYEINVDVDGQRVGQMKPKPGEIGQLNLGLINGVHIVRLSWPNDAYAAGQYDANLRINSISLVPNSISPAPVSGKDQAVANLKALGWTEPAISAVVNP